MRNENVEFVMPFFQKYAIKHTQNIGSWENKGIQMWSLYAR
jgi:hypothetical protein